jgi:hypothetical protein
LPDKSNSAPPGTALIFTHILRVSVWELNNNTIRGFLNGKLVVQAHDDTFKAGKVGLWTKADSETCFDNVKATSQ